MPKRIKPPDPIPIGQRFRQARESSGLTQDAIARKLGCKQPLISAIESGAKMPTRRWLISAAYDLGWDPAILAN